ncbi:MAG: glycosyl transferase family 2, partial [Acidimicrobiales bacterium]|nr:glycosyl transferase family 2 [Acidimicrobiales bacterium]
RSRECSASPADPTEEAFCDPSVPRLRCEPAAPRHNRGVANVQASVVVATRNRAERVGRLLAALEAQSGAAPFEVVIVDDASTDGTSELVEARRSSTPFPLSVIRLDRHSGPAAARNAGWRSALAPLIVFIDDDCTPDARWLAALTAQLGRAEVVQGRTLPDPAQVDGRPFSYTIEVTGEWGYYEACNIGYRRDLLERLGGFDESFRYERESADGAGPIYGEDIDLAWRAKDAGAGIVFEPEALVLHDVRRRSFVDHLRDIRRREGIVMAVSRNPSLRQQCHLHWFWMRSHPPALLALAGLALGAGRSPGRRVAGAALTLPYIRHRTRVEPLGRRRLWPVAIPLAFVADLVEIGAFARASVRHRTLVL